MVTSVVLFGRHCGFLLLLSLAVSHCLAQVAVAESHTAQFLRRSTPPRTAIDSLSIFKPGFSSRNIIEIVKLEAADKNAEKSNAESKKQSAGQPSADSHKTDNQNPEWFKRAALRYVDKDTQIQAPSETPAVRVNPEAPDCAKAMIAAMRLEDEELAQEYAGQCVRYQQNFFFEVRKIVKLIGNALIDQGVIDEESWVGVGQMMDFELAKTRYQTGAVLKPSHEVAMKRIVPDANNEAHIFYFFSLNCSWCRYMAPDLERLWRLVKNDPKIRLTVLTVGPTQKDWITEYRDYTELSMPIYDGSALAKQWNIGFVPAVVVMAPDKQKAYLKTGQQNFERLYEFVKTVQGLPATITELFKVLATTPIGQVERAQAGDIKTAGLVARGSGADLATGTTRLGKNFLSSLQPGRRIEVERF